MHSPIHKIWIHAFWEMVFIGILYISLSKPRLQYESSNLQESSEQALADLVLYLLVFFFLINDIVEIVRRRGISFSSFLNLYTLTANVVLFSVGVITFAVHKLNDEAGKSNNRADLPSYNPLNIGVTLMAFGAILYGLRISDGSFFTTELDLSSSASSKS